MNKLVTKTLADCALTPARKRELEKLAALPDSAIDLSDMPELDESFFKNAIRNPYCRQVKEELTVSLDANVVAWLRQKGEGYHARLNQVLRELMLEDVRKSA